MNAARLLYAALRAGGERAPVDESVPGVPPPEDYASWLDYAVAKVDARAVIRAAARAELDALRRQASSTTRSGQAD